MIDVILYCLVDSRVDVLASLAMVPPAVHAVFAPPPRNHPAPPAKLVTVTLTVVFLYLLATYKILGQQTFPLAIRIHDGMAIQLATVNFCFRVAIYTSVLASNPSFPFKILYQAQL